jgi:hypothetical protein
MGEKFASMAGAVGVKEGVASSAVGLAVWVGLAGSGEAVGVLNTSRRKTGFDEQATRLNSKGKKIKDFITRLILSLLDMRSGDNTLSWLRLFQI